MKKIDIYIPSFFYIKKVYPIKIKNAFSLKVFIALYWAFFLFSQNSFAQKHDTLASVKVISFSEKNITNTSTPLQELNAAQLAKTNSQNITDAIKQFAGVQIKDYGGVGGLKTISVRSLGANHTGIFYDGIAISDAQGGQIDLSKFSLDNIDQIQLFNGNPNDILLPARAFSTASLLTLKTNSGVFNKADKQSLKIQIQQGSFGYFSPSALVKKVFGKKSQIAFTACSQTARNNYPFTSYENSNVKEYRKNSEVNTYRIEFDAAHLRSDSEKIKFKTYYYNSKRALPGSIILFSNSGNQRLNEENFFTQATWQKKINAKHEILFSSNFSIDKNYYVDLNYLNSAGKLENEFHKQELFFSGAYKYTFTSYLRLAYSSDFFKSKLNRTDTFARDFANPDRNTFLNNISVNFKKEGFEIAGNILHTLINENVQNGTTARKINAFAPAFSTTIKPFEGKDFYLRSFYKYIFRAPTFNDLYYTNVGNTKLKPENAEQFNVGVTYSKNNIYEIQKLTITLDGYINNISDRILAVPSRNLFQWSIQNIGKVKIKGIDATIHTSFKDRRLFKITSALSYTYQQALDVSDVTSSIYKTQLPYTPVHTASANLCVIYKRTTLSYNFLGSSIRYRQGDVIAENALNPWSCHDLSLAFSLKERYTLLLSANNILNTQYDIIKFYPMPRFNYRISFISNFKTKK